MTAPGRTAKAVVATAVAACGPVAAANVSGVGRRPYEGGREPSQARQSWANRVAHVHN